MTADCVKPDNPRPKGFLSPLALNKKLYPFKLEDRIVPPPSNPLDDAFDDIQPRYEFAAIVKDPKTGEILFEGHGLTTVDQRTGDICIWLHRGPDPNGMPKIPPRKKLILSGKCEDGTSVFSHVLRCDPPRVMIETSVYGDTKPTEHKSTVTIRCSCNLLFVLAEGYTSCSEVTQKGASVYVSLYNCFLPQFYYHDRSMWRIPPEDDDWAFEFSWGEWKVVMGQYRKENREEAMYEGARGVPTGFLLMKRHTMSVHPAFSRVLKRELKHLLAVLSFATLNPAQARFLEYRDRSQRPILRLHSLIRAPEWSNNLGIIPDRRSLKRFLEQVHDCQFTGSPWWRFAARHLMLATRSTDPGVDGLHSAFAYACIALDCIASNLPMEPGSTKDKVKAELGHPKLFDDGDPTEANQKANVQKLREKWEKELESNCGTWGIPDPKRDYMLRILGALIDASRISHDKFADRVLALETALGIDFDQDEGKIKEFKDYLSERRGMVIHKGTPPLREDDRGFIKESSWLLLFVLHAARMMLAAVGYKGYFRAQGTFTSILFHTGMRMPLHPDDFWAVQNRLNEEWAKSIMSQKDTDS